jgi:hypothetical protein
LGSILIIFILPYSSKWTFRRVHSRIKGGWGSDDWGAYGHQDLSTLKTAKTKEEKMKLLKGMEMKMVAIDYDGKISFPKEKKKD